jgi:hypothetical protein
MGAFLYIDSIALFQKSIFPKPKEDSVIDSSTLEISLWK